MATVDNELSLDFYLDAVEFSSENNINNSIGRALDVGFDSGIGLNLDLDDFHPPKTPRHLYEELHNQGRLYEPFSSEDEYSSTDEDEDREMYASQIGPSTNSPNPNPKPTDSCTACLEDKEVKNIAKLPCSHNYCRDCLKTLFETALKDESRFPPRCCDIDVIRIARPFLDRHTLKVYARKKAEYEARNKTFCHRQACGEFICEAYIQPELELAICPSCGSATCTACKGKAHEKACPSQPGLEELMKMAKEQGWKQCWSCQRMVERKSGCPMMTCRCGAMFCYECGEAMTRPYAGCRCTEAHYRHRDLNDVLDYLDRGLYAPFGRYHRLAGDGFMRAPLGPYQPVNYITGDGQRLPWPGADNNNPFNAPNFDLRNRRYGVVGPPPDARLHQNRRNHRHTALDPTTEDFVPRTSPAPGVQPSQARGQQPTAHPMHEVPEPRRHLTQPANVVRPGSTNNLNPFLEDNSTAEPNAPAATQFRAQIQKLSEARQPQREFQQQQDNNERLHYPFIVDGSSGLYATHLSNARKDAHTMIHDPEYNAGRLQGLNRAINNESTREEALKQLEERSTATRERPQQRETMYSSACRSEWQVSDDGGTSDYIQTDDTERSRSARSRDRVDEMEWRLRRYGVQRVPSSRDQRDGASQS